MYKRIAVALATLSLGASAAVEWTAEDQDWVDDAKDLIASQEANDEEAQTVYDDSQENQDQDSLLWLTKWGGGGWGSGRRPWTCFARSRSSGRVFSATHSNANKARRMALSRCNRS